MYFVMLCFVGILSTISFVSTAFDEVPFLHSSRSFSTDDYVWKELSCSYLEGVNISTPYNSWYKSGTCRYMFQNDSTGQLISPPLGIRSAVQLGGISTGNFELRGDGSFREWNVYNSHPGSATKISQLYDAFLGLRDNNNTIAIQTKPYNAHVQNCDFIDYSGAYPVTKLVVNKENMKINASLLAFSSYDVTSMDNSAVPGVLFELTVKNPTTTNREVSFFLNMPFAYDIGIQRIPIFLIHPKKIYYKELKVNNFEECFNLCMKNTSCMTWNFNSGNESCIMYSDIGTASYNSEIISGVRGNWHHSSQNGIECLTYKRDGDHPSSGNISLCSNDIQVTTATFKSVPDAWNFLNNTSNTSTNAGMLGVIKTTVILLPKETKTLNIALSWSYPYKEMMGEIYGNFYSTLYPYSEMTGMVLLAHKNRLLQNINKLHSPLMQNSLPDFVNDVLINSLGHIRSANWYNNGVWRQYEAYDCTNVDSVHNDGERHIPYIMFQTGGTISKVKGWAHSQLDNGMIQEQLRIGCFNMNRSPKIDVPGGRKMCDSTSMFVVYMLELYQWGAVDKQFLESFYHVVQNAIKWQLNVSSKYSLPYRLVTTYDIIGFVHYDINTYASAFHILSLKAGAKIANILEDKDSEESYLIAAKHSMNALDKLLWNETAGYYNAFSNVGEANIGAVFSDAFYAQVLANTLGLGDLVNNRTRIILHNQMVKKILHNPYGFSVMYGRYFTRNKNASDPGYTTDAPVWMMGNPNWASLQIAFDQSVIEALDVLNATYAWVRSVENNLWDVAAVLGGPKMDTQGLNYVSSHYGYYMSGWHIYFAISGQYANIPKGILTFKPKIKEPFILPIILPRFLAELTAELVNDQLFYQITVYTGNLNVTELRVHNSSYQQATPIITLAVGKQIRWT